ncbi:MAG: L,D-transpeptidase family protein [Chloroflexota bacterium]|nr:L,D-transpeptidase family protein [Chloroflexota bacterium]
MQEYTSSSQQVVAPRNNKRNQTHRAAILVSLGALMITLPMVLVSSVIVYFQVLRLNLPGVAIYDQDVGWRTQEETAALIDEIWNQDRQVILVSSKNTKTTFRFSSKDLGYWIDSAATAKAAYDIGRTADPFSDVQGALKGEKRVILPVLYFDETAAIRALETLAEDLTIPAKDASISYQSNSWVALPGVNGQTLDIETTLKLLHENAFMNLITQSATLQMKSLSPVISNLNFVLDDIDTVLSQELTSSAYDPITDGHFSWSVPIETKRSWVIANPNTFEVHLSYNPQDVENVFKMWEAELGERRSLSDLPDWDAIIAMWQKGQNVHATIYHSPTIYNVEPGESLWGISLKLGIPMWYIIDANPGLTTDNLKGGMNLTIPSKNILLPLPVVPNKRIKINISEQQMQVLENSQIRNTYPVSTGVSDSPTMTGTFQIQTHEINAYASNWDLYMPHFMGIYEAWPDFMNGIHGLPLLSNGHRLWASTLGTPASYGCIILDLEAAEDLYNWADAGVVVEIIN